MISISGNDKSWIFADFVSKKFWNSHWNSLKKFWVRIPSIPHYSNATSKTTIDCTFSNDKLCWATVISSRATSGTVDPDLATKSLDYVPTSTFRIDDFDKFFRPIIVLFSLWEIACRYRCITTKPTMTTVLQRVTIKAIFTLVIMDGPTRPRTRPKTRVKIMKSDHGLEWNDFLVQ